MKKLLFIKILIQSIVSLLLIGIVVLVALWSYNGVRKELVSTYSKYTLTEAKSNAKEIEHKFDDLALSFDYVIDVLNQNYIKDGMLNTNFFKETYSSIAEDFIIFSESGDILYRNEYQFLEDELLKEAFMKTMETEKNLSTPSISKYNVFKIKDETVGIFLYFKQITYGTEHKKIYLTFLISADRILNNYIKNLNLQNKGFAYIVNNDQIVIASGNKEQIGKTFEKVEEELETLFNTDNTLNKSKNNEMKSTFEKHEEEEDKVFDKMLKGESGTMQYTDSLDDHIVIVSFYPINIKGNHWSFAIETPYKFIADTFKVGFMRTVILTAILVLILFFAFVYVIYNYKKRMTAEFEVEHIAALLEKEQELRKAEYKYKQLYQGTRDIIMICNSDFVIEEINNAGIGFIGDNMKIIANKMKFQDKFINKEDWQEFLLILNKNKSIANFRIEIKTEQSLQYLEINADKYFDEKEKKEYIYFIIRDVTEHEKLQKETIEKENLESAMALVVTANHEINNPLAGISLSIDLMKAAISQKDDKTIDNIEKYIDDITPNIYRISDVLEKLRNIKTIKKVDYSSKIKMLDIHKQ